MLTVVFIRPQCRAGHLSHLSFPRAAFPFITVIMYNGIGLTTPRGRLAQTLFYYSFFILTISQWNEWLRSAQLVCSKGIREEQRQVIMGCRTSKTQRARRGHT